MTWKILYNGVTEAGTIFDIIVLTQNIPRIVDTRIQYKKTKPVKFEDLNGPLAVAAEWNDLGFLKLLLKFETIFDLDFKGFGHEFTDMEQVEYTSEPPIFRHFNEDLHGGK